jgi:hypothetical protein
MRVCLEGKFLNHQSHQFTRKGGSAGLCLDKPSGAAYSNPFTSELARDSKHIAHPLCRWPFFFTFDQLLTTHYSTFWSALLSTSRPVKGETYFTGLDPRRFRILKNHE